MTTVMKNAPHEESARVFDANNSLEHEVGINDSDLSSESTGEPNTELTSEVVEITPLIAHKWLVQNARNRKLSPKKVKQYAKDMAAGQWTVTHQGVAFYENGVLADGQHRLQAIIESGVPVSMLVVRGLPLETGADIDRHRPRSETDAIRIGGLSEWMGITEVSVTKAIVNAHRDSAGTFTVKELAGFGELLKPNVEFAVKSFRYRKKYLTVAPVMAAVAIAYDYEDPHRLQEFSEVVLTGVPYGSDDTAALKLREQLSAGKHGMSSKDRKDLTLRTMRALEAFCKYERLKRLQTPPKMIYRCKAIDDIFDGEIDTKE